MSEMWYLIAEGFEINYLFGLRWYWKMFNEIYFCSGQMYVMNLKLFAVPMYFRA